MISKEREAETARNMEIWRQQVQNRSDHVLVGLVTEHFGALAAYYECTPKNMEPQQNNTVTPDVKGGTY